MSPDEARRLVNRLVEDCAGFRTKAGHPKQSVGKVYKALLPMPIGAADAICDKLCRQAAGSPWSVTPQTATDWFSRERVATTQNEQAEHPLPLNGFAHKEIVKKRDRYGWVMKGQNGAFDGIRWVMYATPMRSWCLTPPLAIMDEESLHALVKVTGTEKDEKLAEWKMMLEAGQIPPLRELAARVFGQTPSRPALRGSR